jgi:hypothetical protein
LKKVLKETEEKKKKGGQLSQYGEIIKSKWRRMGEKTGNKLRTIQSN